MRNSPAFLRVLRANLLVLLPVFILLPAVRAQSTTQPPLSQVLETIRAKYDLPALGGAIFTTDGLQEIAATGVRKRGDTTPVTQDDLWHLGSDTKAMTATLLGTYVAEGKVHWDDKITSFYPELADQIPPANRDITLAQVMEHKAGLIENLDWNAIAKTGSLSEQRKAAVPLALTQPKYSPGAFHYSNTDFVLIGAILEKISGQPWEELIRQRLFTPLGMTSAGFGGLGTPGQVDQPWPHDPDGQPEPNNGPLVDNPEVMGPAGTSHITMTDWSKFLVDQLRGVCGLKALLPTEIYRAMQPAAPATGDGYGFGWGVTLRDWAGGQAVNHNGSNNMNYCDCWLAPNKKFGVLVVCNQGGDAAAKACDEAAYALVQRHLGK